MKALPFAGIYLFFLAWGIPLLLSAQDTTLIGYFENQEEGFSLEWQKGKTTSWTGMLHAQGSSLPLEGSPWLGMITGKLEKEGLAIPFSFARLAGSYLFTLNGQSVLMEHKAQPKLPLGAGSFRKEGPSVQKEVPEQEGQRAADGGWHKRLAGKQLLYLYTQGGYTEKTTIDLHLDSSFSGLVERSSNSHLGSGATRNTARDQWKIYRAAEESMLELIHEDGTRETFPLKDGHAASEALLNEKRFFIRNLEP